MIVRSGPEPVTEAFHPIYAMSGNGVLEAYGQLTESGADAVLMLGTGMATLNPILTGHKKGYIPAISCNLALVWASIKQRQTQG